MCVCVCVCVCVLTGGMKDDIRVQQCTYKVRQCKSKDRGALWYNLHTKKMNKGV